MVPTESLEGKLAKASWTEIAVFALLVGCIGVIQGVAAEYAGTQGMILFTAIVIAMLLVLLLTRHTSGHTSDIHYAASFIVMFLTVRLLTDAEVLFWPRGIIILGSGALTYILFRATTRYISVRDRRRHINS